MCTRRGFAVISVRIPDDLVRDSRFDFNGNRRSYSRKPRFTGPARLIQRHGLNRTGPYTPWNRSKTLGDRGYSGDRT